MFGSPADWTQRPVPWLCVPGSRRVCPFDAGRRTRRLAAAARAWDRQMRTNPSCWGSGWGNLNGASMASSYQRRPIGDSTAPARTAPHATRPARIRAPDGAPRHRQTLGAEGRSGVRGVHDARPRGRAPRARPELVRASRRGSGTCRSGSARRRLTPSSSTASAASRRSHREVAADRQEGEVGPVQLADQAHVAERRRCRRRSRPGSRSPARSTKPDRLAEVERRLAPRRSSRRPSGRRGSS